jgi:hypothetical protein
VNSRRRADDTARTNYIIRSLFLIPVSRTAILFCIREDALVAVALRDLPAEK